MRRVATIGTFDGVHTGHRLVLDKVKVIASKRGMQPSVFAFTDHPLAVIDPARVPPKLMTFESQCEAFAHLGVEVFPIEFTPQMRAMSACEYMEILHGEYGVDILVMGYDNRFGHERSLSFDDYCQLGMKVGVEVVKAEALEGVSSTIIRQLLIAGNLDEANKKLGYPYTLSGKVEHGKELGRTIGFPTANLGISDCRLIVPVDGAYAAIAKLSDGSMHGAMVNIGHRPTICDGRTCRSIEANIFDYDADLYGQRLTLSFVSYMRSELRFDDIHQLREQLRIDREEAKRLIDRCYSNNQRI